METKQTAVEWLIHILKGQQDKSFTFEEWMIAMEHGKEMEREQIETAYERGLNFPWALGCEIDNYQEEAKQYYESNYGKS